MRSLNGIDAARFAEIPGVKRADVAGKRIAIQQWHRSPTRAGVHMKPLPSALRLDEAMAHRALLRARLSLDQLADPQPGTPERWEPQARNDMMQARVALDALLLQEPSVPWRSGH